jgi:exopolysaccharide biosynthesis protein
MAPARNSSPGISSEVIKTKDGQTAHVATVDLRRAQLCIAHAEKKNELIETSALAAAHGAAIAVNGGFFGGDGSFVGPVKIDGHWQSKPHPTKLRGAVGFDDEHGMVFDRLTRKDGVVTNGEAPFERSGWWEEVDNILGGIPLLIHDGKVIDPGPEEALSSFLTERYARTAICSAGGSIAKLVVIDGGDRRANLMGEAKGMSIASLSDFLLSLGCTHALNLDGGYSSTYVAFGEKRNLFSIDSLPERKVANILFVIPRR